MIPRGGLVAAALLRPDVPDEDGQERADEGEGDGPDLPSLPTEGDVEAKDLVDGAADDVADEQAGERRGEEVLSAVEDAGHRGRTTLAAEIHGGRAHDHAVHSVHEEGGQRQTEDGFPTTEGLGSDQTEQGQAGCHAHEPDSDDWRATLEAIRPRTEGEAASDTEDGDADSRGLGDEAAPAHPDDLLEVGRPPRVDDAAPHEADHDRDQGEDEDVLVGHHTLNELESCRLLLPLLVDQDGWVTDVLGPFGHEEVLGDSEQRDENGRDPETPVPSRMVGDERNAREGEDDAHPDQNAEDGAEATAFVACEPVGIDPDDGHGAERLEVGVDHPDPGHDESHLVGGQVADEGAGTHEGVDRRSVGANDVLEFRRLKDHEVAGSEEQVGDDDASRTDQVGLAATDAIDYGGVEDDGQAVEERHDRLEQAQIILLGPPEGVEEVWGDRGEVVPRHHEEGVQRADDHPVLATTPLEP